VGAPLNAGSADVTPLAQHRRTHVLLGYGAAVILLLLVSVGGWQWRLGQRQTLPNERKHSTVIAAADAVTASLTPTAQSAMLTPPPLNEPTSPGPPPYSPPWQEYHSYQAALSNQWLVAQGSDSLLAAVQRDLPDAEHGKTTQTIAIRDNWALVTVVIQSAPALPGHRQTRFYQRMPTGWIRTDPDAALWGPEQSLETPSLRYRFRARDAPVVIAVAPQMETLYTTLQQTLGLPPNSGTEKLMIEVSVTQLPKEQLPWPIVPTRILVSSPAVYLAPVELSDEELLSQAIVLSIVNHLFAQVRDHFAIPLSWEPMVNGISLWQLWQLDQPLAAWREEVVRWIYHDIPAGAAQGVVLPERYEELCAAHQLWMLSPVRIGIPLICIEGEWDDWYLAPWSAYAPLTHLNQLTVPGSPADLTFQPGSVARNTQPDQSVALATLIEYAVATYGHDRLPALLAGLGQFNSWETLIPAVYGVSAAEFEAGWQAYLVTHYGALIPAR
jgi:hypothetical protein